MSVSPAPGVKVGGAGVLPLDGHPSPRPRIPGGLLSSNARVRFAGRLLCIIGVSFRDVKAFSRVRGSCARLVLLRSMAGSGLYSFLFPMMPEPRGDLIGAAGGGCGFRVQVCTPYAIGPCPSRAGAQS